jgi:vaccinia related kinase
MFVQTKPHACKLLWTYNVCLQILDRLEVLHNAGFYHGDLKLANIVQGVENPEKLYLIDFGLSACYLDEKGNHVT